MTHAHNKIFSQKWLRHHCGFLFVKWILTNQKRKLVVSNCQWNCMLQLPECQGNPCSKQARNLKFKWLQQNSNHNHFVRKRTLNQLQTKWLWVRAPLQSLSCAFITGYKIYGILSLRTTLTLVNQHLQGKSQPYELSKKSRISMQMKHSEL